MAAPTAYRLVRPAERSLHAGPVAEAISALRTFLPLARARFEQRLGAAMDEASRRGHGFYLSGFAARRALGSALLIEADPRLIEHRLEHRVAEDGRVYLIRDRCLGAGDWTPLLTPVRTSSTYREVEEIVRSDFDYRATKAYRRALDRAKSPSPVNRNFLALRSPELVEAYFRDTADLCRSIARSGVLSRSAQSGRHRSWTARSRLVELGEADIGIAIGAQGQIYRFASGKHRTAAAQALGLERMPVEVRMVHTDWLAQRMREAGSSPADALLSGVAGMDLAKRR